MNKEELLLKNYTILAKNPVKNQDGLLSAVQQLMKDNPQLGIRCWESCIRDNIEELQPFFGKSDYPYDSIGAVVVKEFEYKLCQETFFADAVELFAKNKFLIEVVYAKSPIASYFSASYAISYLIRTNLLQEADNILSAIYKNKTFKDYSELWKDIIHKFKYREDYNPNSYFSSLPKLSEDICNFCIGWIERIKDEEEQAGAMTFAMQLF